ESCGCPAPLERSGSRAASPIWRAASTSRTNIGTSRGSDFEASSPIMRCPVAPQASASSALINAAPRVKTVAAAEQRLSKGTPERDRDRPVSAERFAPLHKAQIYLIPLSRRIADKTDLRSASHGKARVAADARAEDRWTVENLISARPIESTSALRTREMWGRCPQRTQKMGSFCKNDKRSCAW